MNSIGGKSPHMHLRLLVIFWLVGRHRWVEYASKDRYNASQVPPEWHGWLHFITDHTGDEIIYSGYRGFGDYQWNKTAAYFLEV